MVENTFLKIFENSSCYYHLYTGNDYYIKNSIIEAAKKFMQNKGDFTIEKYNEDTSISTIVSNILTCSMFASSKLIIIDDFTKELKDNNLVSFNKLISKNNDSDLFIIFDEKNAFKKLYKYFNVIEFKINDRIIYDELSSFFANKEIEIERKDILYLISLSGGFIDYSMNEAYKLSLYIKNKSKITKADIDNVVNRNLDGQIFSMINALAEAKKDKAIDIVEYFLNRGDEPSIIIYTLISSYKRMFYSSVMQMPINEISNIFNVKPYAIEMSLKNAKLYSKAKLLKILKLLEESEANFKTGKTTAKNTLINAVCSIITM